MDDELKKTIETLHYCVSKQMYEKGIDDYFARLEAVAFGNRKGLVHMKDIVLIREKLKEQK